MSATKTPWHRHAVWLAFGLGTAGCAMYAVLLGQEDGYDLRNYHLYLPHALLYGRFDWDIAAAQIQTFLNPLPLLPFYAFVYFLKPVEVSLAMGALHGLTFGLVFLLSRNLLHEFEPRLKLGLATLAAATAVIAPTFLSMLGASHTDPVFNLFTLLGLLCLTKSFRVKSHHASWLSAGACAMGVAAGLKLVAMVYVAGAFAALLLVRRPSSTGLRHILWYGLAVGLGLVLSRGFWMLHLYREYGSPVFPFFNSIFQSPYYVAADFLDKRYLPSAWYEHLLYPSFFTYNNEVTDRLHGFRDARYLLAWVLLMMFFAVLPYRRWLAQRALNGGPARLRPSERFLLVFFFVSYVLWQLQFSITRYAITLESISGLTSIVLIRHVTPKLLPRAALLLAVLATMLISMSVPDYPRRPRFSRYFQVNVPRLAQPDRTLILMARNYPWSYLIPFFEPGVRFVSVRNNFTRPEHDTKIQTKIGQVIETHTGPMFLLTRDKFLTVDETVVEWYGLDLASRDRIEVQTTHEPPGTGLWRLRRSQRNGRPES